MHASSSARPSRSNDQGHRVWQKACTRSTQPRGSGGQGDRQPGKAVTLTATLASLKNRHPEASAGLFSPTLRVFGLQGIDILTGTSEDTGTTAWIKGLRVLSLSSVAEKVRTNSRKIVAISHKFRHSSPFSLISGFGRRHLFYFWCPQFQGFAAREKLPRPPPTGGPALAHAGYNSRLKISGVTR